LRVAILRIKQSIDITATIALTAATIIKLPPVVLPLRLHQSFLLIALHHHFTTRLLKHCEQISRPYQEENLTNNPEAIPPPFCRPAVGKFG
jgi:hypothetical protein